MALGYRQTVQALGLLNRLFFRRIEATGLEMVTEAEHFLGELQPEQRERAAFSFEDEERFNWHYIPRRRAGVPFRDMTPAQRKLANALMATGITTR